MTDDAGAVRRRASASYSPERWCQHEHTNVFERVAEPRYLPTR